MRKHNQIHTLGTPQ